MTIICNEISKGIERDFNISGMKLVLPKRDVSRNLNSLFINIGIGGIKEGMKYQSVLIAFQYSGVHWPSIENLKTLQWVSLFQLFKTDEKINGSSGMFGVHVSSAELFLKELK